MLKGLTRHLCKLRTLKKSPNALWLKYSYLLPKYHMKISREKINGRFPFTSFLSRLNVVQKETMWSLILYVVCVCSMCMYVCGNFCKIDHCIRIHWCIPMGLGQNDPWVESHVWPQQMWGQRSSRGQWPLVQVLAKSSLYPHTLMYFHGTWTQWFLGRVTLVTAIDVGSKVI